MPVAVVGGRRHQLFEVSETTGVEIYFYWHAHHHAFADPESRMKMARRLSAIDGVDLGAEHIDNCASFSLELLQSAPAWAAFVESLEWFLERMGWGAAPRDAAVVPMSARQAL